MCLLSSLWSFSGVRVSQVWSLSSRITARCGHWVHKGKQFPQTALGPKDHGIQEPTACKTSTSPSSDCDIIITAIVIDSRSMRMLIRCFWAFSLAGICWKKFSLAGNGWTKAPDGQWWSMSGRFNVNNPRHPFSSSTPTSSFCFFFINHEDLSPGCLVASSGQSQPLYWSDSSEKGGKQATNTQWNLKLTPISTSLVGEWRSGAAEQNFESYIRTLQTQTFMSC